MHSKYQSFFMYINTIKLKMKNQNPNTPPTMPMLSTNFFWKMVKQPSWLMAFRSGLMPHPFTTTCNRDRSYFQYLTGGIFWIFFFFYLLYTTLVQLPSHRFHCFSGCWNRRTQDCFDFGIGCQTLLPLG
jgi:hypothetical protein